MRALLQQKVAGKHTPGCVEALKVWMGLPGELYLQMLVLSLLPLRSGQLCSHEVVATVSYRQDMGVGFESQKSSTLTNLVARCLPTTAQEPDLLTVGRTPLAIVAP